MTRATFTIAAIALVCGTGAAAPPVTFESPCECHDNHGKGRRSVKNDLSMLPPDVSAIQTVTPSDVFNWPGLNVPLTWESERTGIENNWYALTGRVVAVKVEADGDLHIAIQDATGDDQELSFAKDRLDRSGVRFLPRTSSFVLRLGFAFDGSRFRGVLFRDAFSGTLFLGEEDSDSWFRE